MLRKFSNIIDKLLVYPDAMIANMNKTGGLIFSQNLLIVWLPKGVLREDALQMGTTQRYGTLAARR